MRNKCMKCKQSAENSMKERKFEIIITKTKQNESKKTAKKKLKENTLKES